MEKIISETEGRMKKAVTALEEEFNTLRTGRASPALFDKIRVEYYGNPTPLNQVATISAPEARLVVIARIGEPLQADATLMASLKRAGVQPGQVAKVSRSPGGVLIGSGGEYAELGPDGAALVFATVVG